MKDKSFIKSLFLIALPISIQSLFQSSLSVIDQFMVGSLGEQPINAIAFSGKYLGILNYTIFAISGTASIMMAQYIGNKENNGVKKAFLFNLILSLGVGIIFFILGFFAPNFIISLYTNDQIIIGLGADYLKIVSLNIFPLLLSSLLSAYLQNNKKSILTMISGFICIICNTLLNWLLIYGIGIFPELGVKGAAIATMVTQYVGCSILIIFAIVVSRKSEIKLGFDVKFDKKFIKTNMIIALPLIITEFMWSLGESIYAGIYGHMSNEAMAAMANISPVISLSIGFFSGVSTAAGIMTGQKLGERDENGAFTYAKRFCIIGVIGSFIMGLLLIVIAKPYSNIYKNLSELSRQMTVSIMIVYSLVLWSKVSNMISGRIIQSGGKTTFNLVINLLGTWVFGIPLGLLAANVLKLDIELVYLMISIEEIIRCTLCFILIKSKRWIKIIE